MIRAQKYSRPSWDDYFMNMAQVAKERSNCLRQEVGAVLVKDKRIIATGYNGTPMGVKNCNEGGCERCLHREQGKLGEGVDYELCLCLHAEQNSVLQAAYHGMSAKGAILYSTIAPCLQCAKALINAGVAEIVYSKEHSDKLGLKLLKAAGVKIRRYK